MSLAKRAKDYIIKQINGPRVIPRGLFELSNYFRIYGAIDFKHEESNGKLIAVSQNFRYGSIITSGNNPEELDSNIKDAILTSFEIPSSYAKEASISKVGDKQMKYALA